MHRASPSDSAARAIAGADALLIDALGTLVSLAPPVPALVHELGRRMGVNVSATEAERALAEEIAFYRAHMGDGRDADSLTRLRRRCAGVLLEALPVHARPAAADLDALTEVLLGSLRFEAFADARDALMRARQRGIRVVVVSNWDVSLLEVLERAGLASLLHGAVTSAAVGAPKPAAEIFRHALALAGVPPDRAVHVGDSLAEDVHGALGCGIPAVLLRRDRKPPPAGPEQATIASLDQLVWP